MRTQGTVGTGSLGKPLVDITLSFENTDLWSGAIKLEATRIRSLQIITVGKEATFHNIQLMQKATVQATLHNVCCSACPLLQQKIAQSPKSVSCFPNAP